MTLLAPSLPVTFPRRLGRYEVRAKIAEGGMATVYVGRETLPSGAERLVALKMIRDEFSRNRDFVTMFLDEAKIVSQFKHPNIVEVYELVTEGSRIFLAMELLFGQSLWQVWDACRERNVRLRYDALAWIGAQIASGLHYAHEMRDASGEHLEIVHRDVNASNIFVSYTGQVKIIDFGLAKAHNRMSKTASGVIKGKVAYMAPEQAIGAPIDRRADLFALGTTLWELSVDRRLFKHTDEIETLKRVHAAEVPDPRLIVDGYPPMLWNVLKRALARDPADRYQTGEQMARDLDVVTRGEGRVFTAESLADVMHELFAEERERQAKWLAEVSAADRPAPAETLHPPAAFYDPNVGIDVAVPDPPPLPIDPSHGGPLSGDRPTFAPPARPPPPASPASDAITVADKRPIGGPISPDTTPRGRRREAVGARPPGPRNAAVPPRTTRTSAPARAPAASRSAAWVLLAALFVIALLIAGIVALTLIR